MSGLLVVISTEYTKSVPNGSTFSIDALVRERLLAISLGFASVCTYSLRWLSKIFISIIKTALKIPVCCYIVIVGHQSRFPLSSSGLSLLPNQMQIRYILLGQFRHISTHLDAPCLLHPFQATRLYK